jgi:hypothetical protein
MITGFTYGDKKFSSSRARALESIKKFTDKAILYTEDDLKLYYDQYPKILYPGARGGGFWLFKAIFLKKTIQEANDGDMVFWMDAGIECTGNLDIFYDVCTENNGFCIFKLVHRQSSWTKRDCFYYMYCDEEKYHNTLNCDASIQFFIKNEQTVKFIDEYLHYCSDYRIVTDSPNECGLPNLPDFVDHRHDQSILTNLCVKHNISRFKHATQWRNIDIWNPEYLTEFEQVQSNKYGVLFNHHREGR